MTQDGRPELRIEGDRRIVQHRGFLAEFSHLRQLDGAQYGGLNAEVRWATTLPGMASHLHEARLNLSSTTARESVIKAVSNRIGRDSELRPVFEDFVEIACVTAIRSFRQGAPLVNLAHRTPVAPQFAVESLFPLHKRIQVFAPAENMKTTLMLAFLMDIVMGVPSLGFTVQQGGAAYLDWETDEDDATSIWHRLAQGRDLPYVPDLFYQRVHGPIWQQAESMAPQFTREGISVVALDSAFWACGGNPNDQDKVGMMFQGIDDLGPVTAVLLNHTASSETEKSRRRHYGLEHFRNASRASWELRKAEQSQDNWIHLGLYRDKVNMRRREGPYGFRVRFDGDEGPIYIERDDEGLVENPELDESRPASDRILNELAHGKATLKQLASALNLPEGTVKVAVHRLKGKVQGRKVEKDYFYELPSLRVI